MKQLPDRKYNGQFSSLNLEWLPMLGVTVFTCVLAWVLNLYLTSLNQKAEINYLKAYSKSIETQGLAHWNNWYTLKNSKISNMDNQEIVEFVFGSDAPLMKRIAKCESSFNAKAENKNSSATGLFQVLSYTHDVSKTYLKDPLINSLIAKKLFQASGTNPWISSVKCWGQE